MVMGYWFYSTFINPPLEKGELGVPIYKKGIRAIKNVSNDYSINVKNLFKEYGIRIQSRNHRKDLR
jgi:hypothetical protein